MPHGCNENASGKCSEAEGIGTVASGDGSHAEGCNTRASGKCSHAEGSNSIASNFGAHAEGIGGTASGIAAHAEGFNTTASGDESHAEGKGTIASGLISHTEGLLTTATQLAAHAEGISTTAGGRASHTEGENTTASGNAAHAEGENTTASGTASHAEGSNTEAREIASHAEGRGTEARGFASHAEGNLTLAIGNDSHAEGRSTSAHGNSSHAEGFGTSTSGIASHAEGNLTSAFGDASHAEGFRTIANGNLSHTEGSNTCAGLLVGAHVMGTNGSPNPAVDLPFSWYLVNGVVPCDITGVVAKILSNGSACFDSSVTASAFNIAAGACDFAEMFETADGQPIDAGFFVTFDGDSETIRKATSNDDYILGVTSSNPAILADLEDPGCSKFVFDEWSRKQYHEVVIPSVTDGEGNIIIPERTEVRPKINPYWDPNQKCKTRRDMPNWVAVGLIGKLLLHDDGTCRAGGYCKPNDDGIATASGSGYRVMKRTGNNQILVLIK
ncbi:peptidase G2 autoproteolytic cleavage domain-containing protein [Brevibacillus sp. 179-C 1.1 NHS]|uniref:peptidase G2 autoproteolytic cleavage domain-containing protein n=1 Tax=Brevibacillus sp. 179-C 1.1 NHS TaxID=3235177 RepID=UPI00399F3DB3